MVNLESFFNTINQVDGVNVSGALNFMEEMIKGKTDEWYTEERKRKYSEISFSEINSVIQNGGMNKIKIAFTKSKLSSTIPVATSDGYF